MTVLTHSNFPYPPVTLPNYSFVASFEQNFDYPAAQQWMEKNWTISCYAAVIYVVVIFGIQFLMRNRKAFDLRKSLSLWSFSLSAFSTIGAYRTMKDLITTLRYDGLYNTLCVPAENNTVASFWMLMFILSKLPELVDTLFIVLRKKNLSFLHYYHHVSVLLYCWYSYSDYTSTCRWFVSINYTVHAIMYFYFGLTARGYKPSKLFAMSITTIQVTQMVVGLFVNLSALQIVLAKKQLCPVSINNIMWSLAMYGSYFYLFSKFFYDAYVAKGKGQPKVKADKPKAE